MLGSPVRIRLSPQIKREPKGSLFICETPRSVAAGDRVALIIFCIFAFTMSTVMNRKFLSLTVFVGVLLALLVGCGEEEPVQGGIELVDVEGHVPVGLKADGISATLEAASSTLYVTRPGETDFSSVDLVFTTEATIILMGDQKVGPVLTGVNLNQPVQFRI